MIHGHVCGSPGIKRLRRRFFSTGFPVCGARLSVTRKGTEERESYDVLLGVARLCRSLRAPGGSRLDRGIM
jgi:hypothetical protein